MAFVGMRYVVFAPIENEAPGQAIEYGEGVVVGHAIGATVNITRNSEDLYGDDMLIESDNSIVGGTVDMTVDDMTDEVTAVMLGHVKGENATQYYEEDKPSPYGGLGYIRVRRKSGKTAFQATWLYKVQMAVATETSATKTESTTWQTASLTGKMMGVKNNAEGATRFRERETFDTEKAATDWLNKLANISTAAAASESASEQTAESGFDNE